MFARPRIPLFARALRNALHSARPHSTEAAPPPPRAPEPRPFLSMTLVDMSSSANAAAVIVTILGVTFAAGTVLHSSERRAEVAIAKLQADLAGAKEAMASTKEAVIKEVDAKLAGTKEAVIKEVDAKLAGTKEAMANTKEAVIKEVDAKIAGANAEVKATLAGAQEAVNAKFAGFERTADLKVRRVLLPSRPRAHPRALTHRALQYRVK